MKLRIYEYLVRKDYSNGARMNIPFSSDMRMDIMYLHPMATSHLVKLSNNLFFGVVNRAVTYNGNDSGYNLTDNTCYKVVFDAPTKEDTFLRDDVIHYSSQGSSDMCELFPSTNTAFKIKEIRSSKFHLVPCLTESNEVYLVDLKSGELYYNHGTGSFSVDGECLSEIEIPMLSRMMRGKPDYVVRLREKIKGIGNFVTTYNQNVTSFSIGFSAKPNTHDIVGFETSANNCSLFTDEDGKLVLWTNNFLSGTILKENGEEYTEVSVIDDSLSVDGVEKVKFSTPLVLFKSAPAINRGECSYKFVKFGDTYLQPANLLYSNKFNINLDRMINLRTGDLYTNQGTGEFRCEGADLGIVSDAMVEIVRKKTELAHIVVAKNSDGGRVIWERKLPWSEHRWLTCIEGDSNAPTIMYEFPLPFRMRNLSQGRNNNILLTNNYSLFYGGSGYALWYNNVTYNLNSAEIGVHDIALLTNGIEIDGNKQAYPTNVIPNKITRLFHNFNMPINIGEITTDTFHLTPAVLNRPTLASEDNNGIARKQGECVFVDYERYRRGLPWCFGNVASSGSFSVSDYLIEGEDYERISGVVANGGAYINTMCNAERLTMTAKPLIISNEGDNAIVTAVMGNVRQVLLRHTWMRLYPIQKGASINGVATLRMDSTQGIFANDTLISAELGTITNIKLLDYQRPECSTAIIGNVTADTFNLIPVRLKKQIEPTCTHNGKGGSEGEYCFFDKISGLAFTNDGSGKFKRFFEEGKDYERIAGVVSAKGAYITLREMPQTLSINLNTPKDINFGGAVVLVSDSNNNISQMYPDSYNANYPYQWVNQGFIFSYWPVDFHAKKDYNFRIDENGDIYESDIKRSIKFALWTTKTECRLFVSNDDGDFIYKSVSSDIFNLIPIKLKKPAYSADTHNGREYSVGTICFYDTISGLIYGSDRETNFGEYIPE